LTTPGGPHLLPHARFIPKLANTGKHLNFLHLIWASQQANEFWERGRVARAYLEVFQSLFRKIVIYIGFFPRAFVTHMVDAVDRIDRGFGIDPERGDSTKSCRRLGL
jgi:hypothetical protein